MKFSNIDSHKLGENLFYDIPQSEWSMKHNFICNGRLNQPENTTRFLADYLNGDIYYNVNPEIPDHNLVRVKAQIEIIKQLEQNENKMKGLIEKYGL